MGKTEHAFFEAGEHTEIERKFLVSYPDLALLRRMPGSEEIAITQVYLTKEDGWERRVRLCLQGGKETCIQTSKKRVGEIRRIEREEQISRDTYEALAAQADSAYIPLHKTRFRLPYADHIVEVDVYPFWNDRAVAEVELGSEDESFSFPDCLTVLREVTGEKEYRNTELAKKKTKKEEDDSHE